MSQQSTHPMEPSRRLPRVRAILLCLLPALVAAVGAVMWHLSGEGRRLNISITFPGLLAQLGIMTSLLIVAVVAIRWRFRERFQQGCMAGEEARRVAHRQFLQRLDHELKNPLTAMRAAANGEDSAQSRAIIDTQSQRMSRLLTDLRKLSDLETAPLSIEDVDIEETTRDAVAAVEQELAARGETRAFDVTFPEAPWPLPTVRGDGDLLYSAIYNLVSNAAKYTDEGAVIEIRGGQRQGTVTLEVADTGIGIPAEDVPVVWAELSRAANARSRPGYGLGLALVNTIVSRHGGSAALSSRLGVGTSTSITLPIA